MNQTELLMLDTKSPEGPADIRSSGVIRRISVRYGGEKYRELERFLKFLMVGALGAVIDIGLANVLMNLVFHVQDGDVLLVMLAGSISFTCAVLSNFMWNRYWTYPDSRSRSLRRQLAQFFLVSVVGLGIRAIILAVFSDAFAGIFRELAASHFMGIQLGERVEFKIGANMAVLLSVVVVAFWNFFANRLWTYNDVDKNAAK